MALSRFNAFMISTAGVLRTVTIRSTERRLIMVHNNCQKQSSLSLSLTPYPSPYPIHIQQSMIHVLVRLPAMYQEWQSITMVVSFQTKKLSPLDVSLIERKEECITAGQPDWISPAVRSIPFMALSDKGNDGLGVHRYADVDDRE